MPVTHMELFFDLVYVFAIIQLSEELKAHLSVVGGLETAVLFLAVWWAWNYTAWATGWLDAGRLGGAMVLGACMVLSLVMAASITDTFGADHHRAPAFALAYVVMQCGRSGFMVWAFWRVRDRIMARNYAQLGAWSAIAGIGWVAGAFVASDHLRLVLWGAAALIDVGAPLHGFWLPGAGHTPMRDWSVAGAHLAERCQLVLMIAFGETVLKLGESFAGHSEEAGVAIAFVVGFVLAAALWALYFLHQADRSAEQIHQAEDDAARMGRSGYTYGHMVMVGGLIVMAVAIQLAVSYPHKGVSFAFACVAAGGPVLYLAGLAVSKVSVGHGRVAGPLVGGVAVMALVAALSFTTQQLVLIGVCAVAVGLFIWSEVDLRRGS